MSCGIGEWLQRSGAIGGKVWEAFCDTLSNDEHGVYRKFVATTAQRLSNVIVQGEAELGGTVTIDTRAVLINIYPHRQFVLESMSAQRCHPVTESSRHG